MVVEDIQADAAVSVDVRVVDGRCEVDLHTQDVRLEVPNEFEPIEQRFKTSTEQGAFHTEWCAEQNSGASRARKAKPHEPDEAGAKI